ncbi:MAG: GNAT family N-acetyltransferase [Thermoleophilia bacterium]
MGEALGGFSLGDVSLRVDDLRDTRIEAFLQEHLDDMRGHSPPESVHALDLEGLRAPDVTFWSAWWRGELIGCVALKRLDAEHVELKSMRTSTRLRRRGLGRFVLDFVAGEARRRGYRRMSLETGTPAFFEPARALYTSYGFRPCPPFDTYSPDPFSVFMTLAL